MNNEQIKSLSKRVIEENKKMLKKLTIDKVIRSLQNSKFDNDFVLEDKILQELSYLSFIGIPMFIDFNEKDIYDIIVEILKGIDRY